MTLRLVGVSRGCHWRNIALFGGLVLLSLLFYYMQVFTETFLRVEIGSAEDSIETDIPSQKLEAKASVEKETFPLKCIPCPADTRAKIPPSPPALVLKKHTDPIIVKEEKPKKKKGGDRTVPERIRNIVTPQQAETILRNDYALFSQRKVLPSIPKIIHQIYRNSSIPVAYVKYIQSWIHHNPDYEYWFWDDVRGREFIAQNYPQFLPLYDAYCEDLFRSDALRYFILHRYGGIYADMDYECFRNFTPILEGHYLQVAQETSVQSKILYKADVMTMNALMTSIPDHPYMHFLINSLPSNAKCELKYVLESTGPLFIYNMRDKYLKTTKCDEHDKCNVYIIPDKQVMPVWDLSSKTLFQKICKMTAKLSKNQKDACALFDSHGFSAPNISNDTFATHHFMHIGQVGKSGRSYKSDAYSNITDIVDNVIGSRG